MKSFQFLTLIAILFVSAERTWCAENTLLVEYFPKVVKQGGVCFVRASGPASIKTVYGEFRGEKFPMAFAGHKRTNEGLLGIDMNTGPATYELKVIAKDGKRRVYTSALRLKVEKIEFKTQKLSLPPSMVDLDPQTLERVEKEEKRLKDLFQGYRDEKLWSGAFVRPVPGESTTAFGLRRIINDQARNPHTGMDLRADEGAPVLASNSGIVALVDQLFFSGKSVILDHGWGTYSMYFHLSQTLVSKGDRVRTGAMLGRVGSTGRSKGPHLHWGIRINGARVDPLALLRLTEHLRE